MEVKLELAPEDYKAPYLEELKKQARKVSLPGFRPGKVPLGMVKKMLGKSVLAEQLNELFSEHFGQFIKEEKLRVLGDPVVKEGLGEEDFDVNAESPIAVVFQIAYAPDISINYTLSEPVSMYQVEADEPFVEKNIEEQRERFAEVTQPDEVEVGDTVFGKLFEVNAEGEAVAEGFEKMIPLSPDRVENEAAFAPLIGKKIDESVPYDLKAVSEDPEALKKLFFLEAEELEQLEGKTLHLTVKRINRTRPAEMNEEFFKRIKDAYGWEDEITDEASLRATLKSNIEAEFADNARWRWRSMMQRRLLEANPYEYPKEFLTDWIVRTNEDFDEEKAREEYPSFARSLTWSLLVNKITEENEAQVYVSDAELREKMIQGLRQQFAQMGQVLDPSQEEEYFQIMTQDEEVVERHFRRLLDGKVFNFLEEKFNPKRVSITATAFSELPSVAVELGDESPEEEAEAASAE